MMSEWIEALTDDDVEIDHAALRQVILATSEKCCTRKQRAMVLLSLDGLSVTEIAEHMGVTLSTAWRHLHGTTRPTSPRKGSRYHRNGKHGGALQKLRDAMAADPSLLKVIQMQKRLSPVDEVTSWFSQIRPSQESMFGPLSVLLVAHFAADAKRTARVEDLCLYMPRRAVNAALGPLKAAGYITTDGVTVTIRKTPIDEINPKETA